MEKVALIFGASSGIGYNVSVQLANKGYIVYNSSRRVSPDERINNLLCDVSKGSEIQDVFNRIKQTENNIDVLVYSSGVSMAAPFEYTTEADYRYLFEVNFFGMAKAVQLALPYLIKNKGRIVLVSSLAAVLPIPYDVFYSCSKACMNTFAMGLSAELDDAGVKIVSVMPGGTKTDFTEKRVVYDNQRCGEYANSVGTSADVLADIEQQGMCPDKVAEVVVEAIMEETPPLCIAAGTKNKFFNQGVKLLPKQMTLEMIKERYKLT